MKSDKVSTKLVPTKQSEKVLYERAQTCLVRVFGQLGECHIEITANGQFSTELEKRLDDYALFLFKEEKYSPDITGFVMKKETYGVSKKIIVAEVKRDISLTSIYQAKRYAEILDAECGFLISPKQISERKKRFIIRRKPAITSYYPNRQVLIAQLFPKTFDTYELRIDKEMYISLPEPFNK